MSNSNGAVQARLRKWGQWIQQPRRELASWPSVFGKIQDEQLNAGARGDGLVCDVIDGVSCAPDGGMSRAYEFSEGQIEWDSKCREINEAVNSLPRQRREIVIATYVVPSKEDPRGPAVVGSLLGIDRSNVHRSLELAHGFIADRLAMAGPVANDAVYAAA